jgi:hypothetical protein
LYSGSFESVSRASNKLTALWIKKDLPPGLYGDGNGLYLQVSKQKTKAWVLRFMVAGRARKMGLGSVDRVSLVDARRKAAAAHSLIVDGVETRTALTYNDASPFKSIETSKFTIFMAAGKSTNGTALPLAIDYVACWGTPAL